jgi:chemotaxis family two-component system response regulator Rcp1
MREETKTLLLLIEDNDDHAELAEFYIEEYDSEINIVRFVDGKEAMEYFQALQNNKDEQKPWLVLLDLKLPKYDGHEILKLIKSHDTLKEIPVVIFSTSNSNKDIRDALGEFANSYIVKPMESDGYANIIQNILEYWDKNQHYLIGTKKNEG